MTVITVQMANVGQKPNLGSSTGNTRNMGSVGRTYQNVYQHDGRVWHLAAFQCGAR